VDVMGISLNTLPCPHRANKVKLDNTTDLTNTNGPMHITSVPSF